MYKIISCIFFFLLSMSLLGQTIEQITVGASTLENIERIVLPKQNNKCLLEEELAQRRPMRPNHFAKRIEVDLNPDNVGTWEYLADGNALWRLRIFSENAKSLNFGFTKFNLPIGASLILYTPNYEKVLGPFTKGDNEEHQELWTPIIDGDEVVVEVNVPIAKRPSLELKLTAIHHDFIGFNMLSGGCNLDVVCGVADNPNYSIVDDYRSVIRSVGLYHLNGVSVCSGALINTTENDCTPYFLTADHCGLRDYNDQTMVVYWNYENSFCRTVNSPENELIGDGTLTEFSTGATLKATYDVSDFTLVELDDPIDVTYQPYFAGWTRIATAPNSTVGIHHPSFQEKRISVDGDESLIGAWDIDQMNTHLIVDNWEIGTTEGGSSGSPLFNEDQQIVGQLSGGLAACGNQLADLYGWINVSWEGGGTPDTRLKDWLDPQGTNAFAIDGKNCGQGLFLAETSMEICTATTDAIDLEINLTNNFSSSVNLSIQNLPQNVEASFANNPIPTGGNTILTLSNLSFLTEGMYTLSISASDELETSTASFILNVVNTEPSSLVLLSPENNALGQSTLPLYNWEIVNASSVEIEVATDSNFLTIVESATELLNFYQSTIFLQSLTTYYWRLRGTNACGVGEWSAPFSFTTGNVLCNGFFATTVPLEISDLSPSMISSSLEIEESGTISDLNVVNLIGEHTYVSDLVFRLISPLGTEVILLAEACDDAMNFNINFDDQAIASFACPIDDGATYRAQDLLTHFNGENQLGVWTLQIEDTVEGDGGLLTSWGLEICAVTQEGSTLQVSPSQVNVCSNETTNLELSIGNDFEEEELMLSYSLLPDEPIGITFSIDPMALNPGSIVEVELNELETIPTGNYILTFELSDGMNTAIASTSLVISSLPDMPVLSSPISGSMGINVNPFLAWETAANSEFYTIEMALDESFIDFVFSENTTNTFFDPPSSLQGLTTYYWRVIAHNECGGQPSEVFNFITGGNSSLVSIDRQEIYIQPNPSTGMFTLFLKQALGSDGQLELFTIDGQVVYSQRINSRLRRIEVELNIASGMYLLRLQTLKETATLKIVIQ